MNEPPDYRNRIRERLRQFLAGGPRELVDVIRACKGAYPTIVTALLKEMEANLNFAHSECVQMPEAGQIEARWHSSLIGIEGNPILSSWYFTSETCSRIAQLKDWSGLKLAFLSTPRLYEWFAVQDLGHQRVLFDLDPVVLRRLSNFEESGKDSIEEYNVGREIPLQYVGKFDCVFVDPPWYPTEYHIWLQRASVLAPGGHLFLSLFPELVRPEAVQERQEILYRVRATTEWALSCSSFLEYDVPSFEKAQLEASGLRHLRPWKLSDLVIARIREKIAPSDVIRWDSDFHRWTEIDVGGLRVFVNTEKVVDRKEALLSILSDNRRLILNSPSRTDPALASINVLTSRGHGLATSNPRELVSLLGELSRAHNAGDNPMDCLKSTSVDEDSRMLLAALIEEN